MTAVICFNSIWYTVITQQRKFDVQFCLGHYLRNAPLIDMKFAPLEKPIELPEEMLLEIPSKTERKGFTLVEWGGSVLDHV